MRYLQHLHCPLRLCLWSQAPCILGASKEVIPSEVYEVPLTETLIPELVTLTSLAVRELDVRDISLPEGKAKVKTIGSAFMLEWTGSTKDISLEPTDRDLVAKLTVKETSWYRNLVQLHKAKGGVVFKVYAAFFAFVLGMLLISGFMMAWQTPKLKRITLGAFAAGIISFLVIGGFS